MPVSKIAPGLFVGSFHDAKDQSQLQGNNITHILSILENAKKIFDDREYLCIPASDLHTQDLMHFFPTCIDFIHNARLNGGNVLVHCLAGRSRSVTVTAAYLMTVTSLGSSDVINVMKEARKVAKPNLGFQMQLRTYEIEQLRKARKMLKEKYPENPFSDEKECKQYLQKQTKAGVPKHPKPFR